MAVETTYTNLRDQLSSYLDRVTDDQEIVIVRRRGARDVAMIPASELASLIETAHLMRSPKNAERLMRALGRAEHKEGAAMAVDDLREALGLGTTR
jgi:antitoxin YefM